jgi:uncharacterized protein (TIGR00725 family)
MSQSCYNNFMISRKKRSTNHNLASLNSRRHLKYKIAISGAAETGHCSPGAVLKAEQVGAAIAKAGMVLVTGATNGIPYWAAKGAKEAGGFVVGFSPASSEAAHIKTYHLPTDYHDIIVYTGFDYDGRDLIMTRAADGVITVCGRVGSLHEFTTTFEDKKPSGVLEGSGGVADMIREILTKGKRGFGKTVFDTDPTDLVAKVIVQIAKQEMINHEKNHAGHHMIMPPNEE